MLNELDLFVTYRWALATVCTVYAAVRIAQTLWRWMDYFASSHRAAVMGRYAGTLLLRLRLRRFAWELGQIAALSMVLVYVIYLHHRIGP